MADEPTTTETAAPAVTETAPVAPVATVGGEPSEFAKAMADELATLRAEHAAVVATVERLRRAVYGSAE